VSDHAEHVVDIGKLVGFRQHLAEQWFCLIELGPVVVLTGLVQQLLQVRVHMPASFLESVRGAKGKPVFSSFFPGSRGGSPGLLADSTSDC
jgi:hypothetical protein